MPKTTKSPTFAVLPFRQGKVQDVFFYHVLRSHGQLQIDEALKEKYLSTNFGVGERDRVIDLLVAAGITVRYYDPEEKKWMDQSLSGGLEPAPGDRDGTWGQPDLSTFKKDYLGVRFGASAAA